jgi:DNA-binding transcriptional LysR family regulator
MSAEGLIALRDGEIDLGIGVIQDGPDFPAAYHQLLFDDRFVVMMRDTHPLAKGDLDVESFAGANHALMSISGRGKGEIDRRLADVGFERKIALRMPHFLAIHSAIARTDLIVTLPERIARQSNVGGLIIKELPKEIEGGPFTLSQIWHERFHQDPARKWLRSIVKSVSSAIS